jgi:hypothetical protein
VSMMTVTARVAPIRVFCIAIRDAPSLLTS